MEKTVVFEKSKFLTGLEARITALESKTEKALASLMREEAAANVENDLNKLVSEFKKNVSISSASGSVPKFPDEIYAAVMKRVIAVEAPKITGGADVEGSIIKTIGAYISDLLNNKPELITVGKKNYVLSNPIGSAVAEVTVEVDGKTYTFTWNDTSGASQTAKSFMESATNFGKERFTIGLLTALFKDVMATETAEKVKDGFVRWAKALLSKGKEIQNPSSSLADKVVNKFLIDLGKLCSAIYNYNTNYIGNLITGATGGLKTLLAVTKELFKGSYKGIVSVTDTYAALMEKYDALDSYVRYNEVSPTELIDSPEYKNFVKAFNTLETAISESNSALYDLIESATGYKFADVHNETIDESRASVYGTSQNDTILVNGSNVRVYGGDGNDDFIANGRYITVIGEQGNDMVLLRKEGDTYDNVDTGDGNDTIFAYSGRNTINGGSGDDTILVYYTDKKAEKNQVYGGAGNDIITIASATGNTVVGEDGDDIIYINGEASSNTISGGKGNDIIDLTGSNHNVITYQNGDGNDTIFGFNADDTLYILDGDTSTSTVGADVVVQVGSGSITIKDGAGKSPRIIRIPTGEEIAALLKELQNNKTIFGTSKIDIIDNSVSGANIDGGTGDDSIYNGGANVTIDGGTGDDRIHNYYGDSVSIDGGTGDDSIDNSGDNVTIFGGTGNDTIRNIGDNVTIYGGDGNDSIVNRGDSVTIFGGVGDDSIYNSEDSNVTIDGGAGDDSIYNSGDSVTIDGGAGNDTIWNFGNSVTIYGGAGNDSIFNSGESVTIDCGVGDDSIFNSGESVTIDGGMGNDSIYNYCGDSVTIDGGEGNDTIRNYRGDSVSVDGGAGDDLISLYGSSYSSYWRNNNNTISGGAGNDTVYLNSSTTSGNVYVYANGDGNDLIYNATRYDTISIGGGEYSTQTSGSNLIIKVGYGAMTLFGAANTAVKIVGTLGTGNEEVPATIGATINNTVSGVTLNGTANKDSIMNYAGDEVLITADADADTIFSYGDSVTISAGAGNDIIEDAGINSLIDGGAGNDTISLTGGGINSVVTVSGGLGDDMIYGDISAHIYQYKQGDGNDTIFGYNSDDTLYISTGSINSASISGEDVVLKIGGGTVNLKAAKAQPLKLKNSGGNVIETIIGGNTIPEEITIPAGISIRGATLTASTAFTGNSINLADFDSTVTKANASALSRGISIVGTAADNSLKGGKGADTIFGGAGNDTVSLGGGADFYIYSSGNDLIQDYAAADKIKIVGASITGSSLSGSNVVLKTSSGNLNLKNGKDKQITIVDASDSIISTVISGGSSTTGVTIDNSNNHTVIAGTSYADSIKNSGKNVTINAGDGNDYIYHISESWKESYVTVNAGAGQDTIIGRYGDSSISGGAGNDIIDISIGDVDRATINGGMGDDTIYNDGYEGYYTGENIFQYTDGDGNDLIYGYTSNDTISISGAAYSTSTVGNDIIISVGSGKITLKDAKYKTLNVKGTLKGGEDGITVKGAVLTAGTTFTGNKIDLANYSGVTKVNASALSRGVSIVGTAADNSLKGGKGADTILGAAGNDTVSLGAGADVYVYESGNDLIQDYAAGADKIKLASSSITGASLSGSNVVLKTSAGNITVKGAKNENITVIDSKGKETSQIYPLETLPAGLSYDSAKKVLTVGTSYGGAAIDLKNYATTTKNVDASKFTKAIKITGTSRAESLVGGSKADTLSGGKGNDTLTGNGGNDVFVYSNGDGADVIADFTAGQDSIKLASGAISSASIKSADMIFKIGSGSLTVKNGKGKEISVGNEIYYNNLIYDGKKTAVTLASGSLKASDYASTAKKIDASKLSKSASIIGNSQANTILGGAKADTIYGGKGNDSILGDAGNDKLFGDAGADTLVGGAGNDTLTGGDGKDVFVYSSGDGADVIADFTAGQDSIKLASGAISSASIKSADMIFKIGNGSLTIKNGKGKEISVGNEIYYNNLIYDGKKTAVTLASGSLKASDYASTIKKIDASKLSKSASIIGNSQANTMLGGAKADTIYGGKGNDSILGDAGNDKIYGDAGADTLVGGAGNDTLTGGDGKDVFVYSAGKDVITDYAAGDKIKISSGSITKTSYSGNNVIFTVGSGTLTVQKGKGKEITIADASGKTTTQTYSGAISGSSKNVAPWFVEDDNFVSDALDAVLNVEPKNYHNGDLAKFADFEEIDSADKLVSSASYTQSN